MLEEMDRERRGDKSPADAPVSAPDLSYTDIANPEGRTDVANARRFIDAYGNDIRFCTAWRKWIVWTGTRWKIDDDGAAHRMATAIADQIWNEIPRQRTKDVLDFAQRTSKLSGINAMLGMAESMCPVGVSDLDAHPWLLNCQNGTVDLRTGTLRLHRSQVTAPPAHTVALLSV